MTSKTALQAIVSGLVRGGIYPRPVETTDKTRLVGFVTAEIDRPRLMTSLWTIDGKNRLQSVLFNWQDQQFEIRRLVLSNSREHRLTRGNWPKLPTKTVAENDFVTIMRVTAAALKLLTDEMKPIESATKSDPAAGSNR